MIRVVSFLGVLIFTTLLVFLLARQGIISSGSQLNVLAELRPILDPFLRMGEFLWSVGATYSISLVVIWLGSVIVASVTRHRSLSVIPWWAFAVSAAFSGQIAFIRNRTLAGALGYALCFMILALACRKDISRITRRYDPGRITIRSNIQLALLVAIVSAFHFFLIDVKPGVVPIKVLPYDIVYMQKNLLFGPLCSWSLQTWWTFFLHSHVPFRFLALYGWLHLFGSSPVSILLNTAAIGLLNLFPFYYLAKTYVRQSWLAIAGTLLYMTSPFLLSFSRYVGERSHTLSMFQATLLAYFLIRSIKEGKLRFYLVTALLAVSALFLYESSYILMPAALLILIIEIFLQPRHRAKRIANSLLCMFVMAIGSRDRLAKVFEMAADEQGHYELRLMFMNREPIRDQTIVTNLHAMWEYLFHSCQGDWFSRPGPIEISPIVALAMMGAGICLLSFGMMRSRVTIVWTSFALFPAALAPWIAPRRLIVLIPALYLLTIITLSYIHEAITRVPGIPGKFMKLTVYGFIAAVVATNYSQYMHHTPLKEVEQNDATDCFEPIFAAPTNYARLFHPKDWRSGSALSFLTSHTMRHITPQKPCTILATEELKAAFLDSPARGDGIVFTTSNVFFADYARWLIGKLFPEVGSWIHNKQCWSFTADRVQLERTKGFSEKKDTVLGKISVTGGLFIKDDGSYKLRSVMPNLTIRLDGCLIPLQSVAPQPQLLLSGLHELEIELPPIDTDVNQAILTLEKDLVQPISLKDLWPPELVEEDLLKADRGRIISLRYDPVDCSTLHQALKSDLNGGVRVLTFDPAGNLYLVSAQDGQLQRFDRNLRCNNEWASWCRNRNVWIQDITVGNRTIVVATKERVFILDENGKLVKDLDAHPLVGRVATNSAGAIAVLDVERKKVKFFHQTGTHLKDLELPSLTGLNFERALDLDFISDDEVVIVSAPGVAASYTIDGRLKRTFNCAVDILSSRLADSAAPDLGASVTVDRTEQLIYVTNPVSGKLTIYDNGDRVVTENGLNAAPQFPGSAALSGVAVFESTLYVSFAYSKFSDLTVERLKIGGQPYIEEIIRDENLLHAELPPIAAFRLNSNPAQ